MSHTITRLSVAELRGSVKELAGVFVDVVADGSSLGFLAPLHQDAAVAWWRGREPAVADGSLLVWVARGASGITGTISLRMGELPNARHRAEVLKLMVHRAARGQGVGRALLATAERAAAEAGVTLLVLDTETGSAGERLYQAAGWTRFGVVPDYATDPAGVLKDGSFFYKRLG